MKYQSIPMLMLALLLLTGCGITSKDIIEVVKEVIKDVEVIVTNNVEVIKEVEAPVNNINIDIDVIHGDNNGNTNNGRDIGNSDFIDSEILGVRLKDDEGFNFDYASKEQSPSSYKYYFQGYADIEIMLNIFGYEIFSDKIKKVDSHTSISDQINDSYGWYDSQVLNRGDIYLVKVNDSVYKLTVKNLYKDYYNGTVTLDWSRVK